MKMRRLLWMAMVLVSVLAIAACGGAGSPVAEEPVIVEEDAEEAPAAAEPAGDCTYTESPMLAEEVAAGELPGLCERLPVTPLVFTHDLIMPAEFVDAKVGTHGGSLVSTIGEGAILLEPLFYSINRTPVATESLVFSDFQPNDDYTEFTFTLREGLKWSDGVPVTTEDLDYSWNDVLLNAELYPTFPSWLRTGGSGTGGVPTYTKVDDATFRLTYDAPFPGFGRFLSGNWRWTSYLIKPRHYLSQFHVDYADSDTLTAAVEEAGFDEWYELHTMKDVIGANEENGIGMPRLDPWLLVEHAEDRYIMERNPYYGSVDVEGNQLPYIDEIVTFPVSFTAPETAELMMFSGEGHYNWNLDLTKLPLYKQQEANGTFWSIPYPNKDSRQFTLNLTYDDPTWRSVVQDVRFRKALGLAMDCETINAEIYLETASIPTITHTCPYDPDAANALLDEMGMNERDADGFRLAPNGEPFEIAMTLMAWDIGYNAQAPFLTDYFQAVGIRTSYEMVESNAYWQMMDSNEQMATIIWSFSPKFESNTQYPEFQPTTKNAPLWFEWYTTGGTQGEEPPDWIKESFEIAEALAMQVYGTDEYKALEARRDAWVAENVPYLDFVEQPGIVHMFSTCLDNVATGPIYHHGSWTHHRLIFFKPDC